MTEEKECQFKSSSQEEIFTAKIQELDQLEEFLAQRKQNLKKGLEEAQLQRKTTESTSAEWSKRIELDFPVGEEEVPFKSFFVKRILDQITIKYPQMAYRVVTDSDRRIVAIEWRSLGQEQEREVRHTLAWTLRRIQEKREGSNK